MAEPIFHYDEESDTLYVSFAPGEAATGIALHDHMLLRINKHDGAAVVATDIEQPVRAPHQAMRSSKRFDVDVCQALAQLEIDHDQQPAGLAVVAVHAVAVD